MGVARPISPNGSDTTQTVDDTSHTSTMSTNQTNRVFRLRLESTQTTSESEIIPTRETNGRRVTWRADTVDNENLGRKKSNICCLFHATSETSDNKPCNDDNDLSEKKSSPSQWNAFEP